jgi:RHS repeat-associated protein
LIASEAPLAAVPAATFTDDPLVAGETTAKVLHINELRTAITAARAAHGLGAFTWTDPTLEAGTTPIKVAHIAELRTALNAVYTAAGVSTPTYTDATLTTDTALKAAHIQELRTARNAVPAPTGMTPSYYHVDLVGSVRAVTDSTGTPVRWHDYTPFGEEPSPVPGADARRFAGKERDAETGLDYFSARQFQAGTGRFTTVDPGHIAADEWAPQTFNGYASSLNNPLKFSDPTGTDAILNLDGYASIRMSDSEFMRLTSNPGVGFRLWGGFVQQMQGSDWVTIGSYSDPLATFLREIATTTGSVSDGRMIGAVYAASAVVGAVGAVAATGGEMVGLGVKFGVHSAHHTFQVLGRAAHLQLNVWRVGVKGSQWALRLPIPMKVYEWLKKQ